MNVREIEQAISQLPPADIAALASWFEEFHAQAWDKQIEQDLEQGRLDGLIAEAEQELAANRCRPL